ncbi:MULTISPECIES: dTMP kinase [Lysinibacillus]|uniref:Thymidylate kinase n=1 Tax=Lysinibacillus capsici TaxID=2115968 RepID=A0ABY8KK76_9BACI|nr:dTMP kinase [Lysinibacillus capsici]MCT1538516.1 dTMP kinase [Lysinibacillus capsici]MCT1569224.1 dTMP kinase [Lysinibacillus capsici]MCT1646239.1 dTMP kinase [Lysinibacillus capsici]MCT1725255.1 dTMP kinase [Lysinibacillus capsici]MCT1784035.1 dTMP kinase [Lysinibacillus capsici]
MTGKWITFEGIGGSGKTTQINLLYKYLKNQTCDVILTKEPGGTAIGEILREILVNNFELKLESLSELFLFEADRHETVKKVVNPNIELGKLVLSDRGIDGSVAYQGFGRKLEIEVIHYLTSLATEDKAPDLTILIDINPEIAHQRIINRNNVNIDKFDLEKIQFQTNVRNGFLYMAKQNPKRIIIVDGSLSVEELHQTIVDIVKCFAKGEVIYKG